MTQRQKHYSDNGGIVENKMGQIDYGRFAGNMTNTQATSVDGAFDQR